MKKALILIWFGAAFLVLTCCATADVVYLKDNTQVEGRIVEENEDEVAIEVQQGDLKAIRRIKRSEISKIEKRKTPQEEYVEALSSLPMDDAKGFYELGKWCKEKGMLEEAKLAFMKALEIDPGFDEAGKELGWVCVSGVWQSIDYFLEKADTLIQSKKYEPAAKLLKRLWDAVSKTDTSQSANSMVRRQILMRLARCFECLGKWDDAVKTYDLIVRTSPPKAELYKARVRQKIIREHPDGKFNCPYDPSLFPKAELQKRRNLLGVQSLTRPEVMEFAVRCEANKILEAAARKVAKADDEMRFKPEEADRLYQEAAAEARQADYLVPEISRPLLVKIAFARGKLLDILAAKAMKEVQADPGYKWTRNGYPGTLEQAEQFLEKATKVCELYEKKVKLLQPFPQEASKELDKTLSNLEKARDTQKKAQKMVAEMRDFQEIERLEAAAAEYAAKAKAIDPRQGTYPTDAFPSADGLYHFLDDGKEWRRRSELCIEYCQKALEAGKKRLELMRKYPQVYSRDMFYAKRDMVTIYQLMMRTVLDRNKVGTTTPTTRYYRWR